MILIPSTDKKGIAAIGVMVVIAVLVVAVTITVPIFLQTRPVDRNNITRGKIRKIKHAIVGDRQKYIEKSRTSFGFVGDLGVLPNTLSELRQQGTYPSIAQSQNLWFGWHGPYLTRDADLIDAWGNPIRYTEIDGDSINRDDPDNLDWPVKLWSHGEDGLPNTDDDVYDPGNSDFTIDESEVRAFVAGTFTNRLGDPIPQDLVTVYFPNGTAALDNVIITTGTHEPGKTAYNSEFDMVSDPAKQKIPIGTRYFLTQDENLPKLVTLNGVGTSNVHFVAAEEVTLYEHDFSNKDNLTFLGGGAGAWKTGNDGDGDYLAYQGNAQEGDVVIAFGNPAWTDYRVEMEVSIADSNKIDGFGIDYRANYSGNPTPDSGYRFTYYPEPLSYFTIKRLPTDFVPPEPNYGGYDFGYFKFTVTVQTNLTTIAHTIKIEKRIAGVLVTQTTVSISENRTADSVLSGQVGIMAFGQLQSIRLHHVTVSPL